MMLNGVNSSVKTCKNQEFNTLKHGVKSVNLTDNTSYQERDTIYIKEIISKKRECLITSSLVMLLLILRYLQQVNWKVQLMLLIAIISYSFYQDILNITLWISDRSRAYVTVSALLIGSVICSVGVLPVGCVLCCIILSIVLVRYALVYNDIYMMHEATETKKEIRNESERQERHINKLQKQLEHYTRLEDTRQKELTELKETIQSYESELLELRNCNNKLVEELHLEKTYSNDLKECNDRFKAQIESLEQMAAVPKVINDVFESSATSDSNISNRDRKILNYLTNTDKSLREIASLIGCSHVTVKNVKERYLDKVS